MHVMYLKYTENYVWSNGKGNTIVKTKIDVEVNMKIHLCKMVWEVSYWIN